MDDNIKLIISEVKPEELNISNSRSENVKQKTREQLILVRLVQQKPIYRSRRMSLMFN